MWPCPPACSRSGTSRSPPRQLARVAMPSPRIARPAAAKRHDRAPAWAGPPAGAGPRRSHGARASPPRRPSGPARPRRAGAIPQPSPRGPRPGPRSFAASRTRAWSRAASGTSLAMRVAVSAERRASGRSIRSIRSGSTLAERTAKAMSTTTTLAARTAALHQRLGADVDLPEHRQVPASNEDRLATLGGDGVDGDEGARRAGRRSAPRRPSAAPAGRRRPRPTTAAAAPARISGIGGRQRDGRERAEVEAGREGARVAERPGPG